MEGEAFKQRHRRTERDFIRDRCLTFPVMILFLINMVKRALQDELDEFFRLIEGGKVSARTVSKGAFSQARKKLKHTAFIELNEAQVGYFYEHYEPEKWHGLHLRAIDGSLVDVPDVEACRIHFGTWSGPNGKGCAKGRASQLFDPLNKLTIDAYLAPKSEGERLLAERHFQHLGEGDLLLLDRGYPAFWIFQAILQRQAMFCARLAVEKWQCARAFLQTGLSEQLITLTASPEAKKACQKRGLPITPMTLRLIRVELDNGEVEVLITALLDAELFPHSLFKELYFCRWPVETDYRFMKSRLELENWTGLSPEAVYQDFHAAIFSLNFAAILAQPAQAVVTAQTQQLQHPYQINMTNLLSKLKDTIVHFFRDLDLSALLDPLWQQMVRTLEPLRPHRSYPRHKKVHKKKFPTNYKSIR